MRWAPHCFVHTSGGCSGSSWRWPPPQPCFPTGVTFEARPINSERTATHRVRRHSIRKLLITGGAINAHMHIRVETLCTVLRAPTRSIPRRIHNPGHVRNFRSVQWMWCSNIVAICLEAGVNFVRVRCCVDFCVSEWLLENIQARSLCAMIIVLANVRT